MCGGAWGVAKRGRLGIVWNFPKKRPETENKVEARHHLPPSLSIHSALILKNHIQTLPTLWSFHVHSMFMCCCLFVCFLRKKLTDFVKRKTCSVKSSATRNPKSVCWLFFSHFRSDKKINITTFLNWQGDLKIQRRFQTRCLRHVAVQGHHSHVIISHWIFRVDRSSISRYFRATPVRRQSNQTGAAMMMTINIAVLGASVRATATCRS